MENNNNSIEDLSKQYEEFEKKNSIVNTEVKNTEIEELEKQYLEFINNTKEKESSSEELEEIEIYSYDEGIEKIFISKEEKQKYIQKGEYYVKPEDATIAVPYHETYLEFIEKGYRIFHEDDSYNYEDDFAFSYTSIIRTIGLKIGELPSNSQILAYLQREGYLYVAVDTKNIFYNEDDYSEAGYIYDNTTNFLIKKPEVNYNKCNNYQSIVNTLEDTFPEKWDLVNYRFQGYSSEDNLIIRFPEITIVNSKKETHKIVELYVVLPFIINSSNNISFTGSMLGFRGELTESEYLANYSHSHLPSTNTLFKLNKFCLGTGNITSILINLKNNYDDLLFKGLLINIESYLAWESLEGRPHIAMSNVFNKSNEININRSTSFSIPSDLKGYITNSKSKISVEISNKDINFNFSKLEDILTQYCIENHYTSLLANFDSSTGKYYKIITNSLKESILLNSPFKFRGDFIKGKVLKGSVSSVALTKKVNPNFTNYINEKLKTSFKSSYFKSKRIAKIRKTYPDFKL